MPKQPNLGVVGKLAEALMLSLQLDASGNGSWFAVTQLSSGGVQDRYCRWSSSLSYIGC